MADTFAEFLTAALARDDRVGVAAAWVADGVIVDDVVPESAGSLRALLGRADVPRDVRTGLREAWAEFDPAHPVEPDTAPTTEGADAIPVVDATEREEREAARLLKRFNKDGVFG